MTRTSRALAYAARLRDAALLPCLGMAALLSLPAAAAPKSVTLCGTAKVDVVQCFRAPCPPLVFLTTKAGKEVVLAPASSAPAALAPISDRAYACVKGIYAPGRQRLLVHATTLVRPVDGGKAAPPAPTPPPTAPQPGTATQ
jgi:hypothetical protein